LGNIRLSYSDNVIKNGIIEQNEIIEENNYYPFGLEHKGYNNVIVGTENNHKTFNGKELEKELGLNWTDYGSRRYMSDLGRWASIDPLADKYRDFTPYNYTANNPILYVDPDGEKIIIGNNTKDALTKLAQIAATNKGQQKLDRLVNSKLSYTMRSVFWTRNSGYDDKGTEGRARTIYYPSSVWMFDVDGGHPGSTYILGHELNHAYDHDLGRNMNNIKDRESGAVNMGNYLRSVYGEDDMRTKYWGLGLKFSDDPKSYNRKGEGVKDFTETLSVEAGGSTFLGFSYEKSEGGETSTEYIISVKTEDGTFAYRKFTDQKEYNAAVKRINEYQKKQKEKEDEQN
jgi:RHS repeat-associated protein